MIWVGLGGRLEGLLRLGFKALQMIDEFLSIRGAVDIRADRLLPVLVERWNIAGAVGKPGFAVIDREEFEFPRDGGAVAADLKKNDRKPHKQQCAGCDQSERALLPDDRLAQSHR